MFFPITKPAGKSFALVPYSCQACQFWKRTIGWQGSEWAEPVNGMLAVYVQPSQIRYWTVLSPNAAPRPPFALLLASDVPQIAGGL
jgi:hypothetical protein